MAGEPMQAHSTKVELLPVTQHAADMLDHYASFIRTDVKADDFERHPYVPEIEETAQALRELARHHPSHGGEELREAAQRCRDIAMRQCVEARIPECGKFSEIAQDLDAALASPPPVDRADAGDLDAAADAYAAEYVMSTEGDDYVPTEWERALIVDALHGFIAETPFAQPLEGLTSGPCESVLTALRVLRRAVEETGIHHTTPSVKQAMEHATVVLGRGY